MNSKVVTDLNDRERLRHAGVLRSSAVYMNALADALAREDDTSALFLMSVLSMSLPQTFVELAEVLKNAVTVDVDEVDDLLKPPEPPQ